jgi:hypothetical protein
MLMNTTNRNVIIGVVVVVIVALIAYGVWQEKRTSEMSGSTATSTTASSSGVAITVSPTSTTSTSGGYTITRVTPGKGVPPPNSAAPLVFTNTTVTAEEQSQMQTQFTQTLAVLKTDSTNYSAWIELGLLREEAGDYAGAAVDWKYVTEIYPTDPTAFADLGDLYATYLKQPAQGIVYYKDAIKNDPTKEETFYQNLAQIYINEGDTADAKAVLQQGINAKVIGYQNLQAELNSMQ